MASPRSLVLTSPLLTCPKKLFSMIPQLPVMTFIIWYWHHLCSYPYPFPNDMHLQGWDHILPILVLQDINPISDAKRVINTCGFDKTHISSNAGPSSPGTKEKGTSLPSAMIAAQCSREEHSIIPPPVSESHETWLLQTWNSVCDQPKLYSKTHWEISCISLFS